MIPDGELLRRYTETHSESAFTALVERHLALVYSAALRQVNGDAHLAQDVAQTVFADLAGKAATLAGRPVLTGWLYTSAHFAAAKAVRTEQRRHTREQEAHLMNQLLCDPAPDLDWEKLRPVLDAAMLELNETDREAVLLRYFDNRPHAEIADRLGLSENAARMRVERALEKLHALLIRRGVSTTAALSAVISANAVQVAPAGLAATLSTAALAGTTLATTATAITIKTIAMTTLQKTLITVTIVAAVGAGIYEARQASTLRTEVQTLRQQQAPLAEHVQQLTKDRDDATRQLAALRDDNERLNRNTAELLKLRGETGRLRNDAKELAQLKAGNSNDPVVSEAVSWKERVKLLKQHLEQNPGARIPELQFATDQDWLNATRGELETEKDYRRAMSGLRSAMESRFAGMMLQPALKKFMDENNNQFPTDLSQLQPYFKPPVDAAILQRYAILPKEEVPSIGVGGKWIISQKSPVDQEFDSRVGVGPLGHGSSGGSWGDESLALASAIKTLSAPLKIYKEANNGEEPINPSQLQPYLTSSEQQQALQKVIQAAKAKTQSGTN